MDDDSDYERTLCQLPQVHVFKIPVRKSAEGHRASDWPKDPTWTGKLKVIAKGRVAAIILLDDKNATFAVCPVSDDTAVERTLDSGRYFVLKIQNAQGRHAFIGIAFNERNDAFDFNVALQEHKDSLAREDAAASSSGTNDGLPTLHDLSIKDGEKIKIKLAGGGGRQEKRAAAGGGGLLSPPPSSRQGGALLAPPPADKAAHNSITSPTPAATKISPAASVFDDFASSFAVDPLKADPFGSFGADPF